MDLIRAALDKVGEQFHKGKKYAPLHALYEAPDTILYTPPDVTRGPSHVRDGLDLKRMMITVVAALMPCLLWGMYNVGYQAAIAVGQVVDQVIQPHLMGNLLGLQPAWLLIVLPIGARAGDLFGLGSLLGLLVAVPVASCAKTFVDAWQARLSPEPVRPEPE